MRTWLARLRALAGSRRREIDLDDEVRAHLDLLAAEHERRGLTPSEARLAARRAFGAVEPMKERYRDDLRPAYVDSLLRDLRHSVRALRRTPAFTVVAVLTIGLGIGANTAIVSVLEGVLLRPLPVRDPGGLVQFVATVDGRQGAFSYPIIQELARRNLFDGVFGFNRAATYVVGDRGRQEEVSVALVTGGYYDTLGLAPAAGRLLRPDDDRPGATPVVVLSYGYWQRRFGGDPSIVGRTIAVEGVPVTIAGVSPSGFTGVVVGRHADITLPIGVLPQVRPVQAVMVGPRSSSWYVMARLPRGVSREEAARRVTAVWPGLVEAASAPAPMGERLLRTSIELAPGGSGWAALRQQFTRPLVVLMALVTLVLLIACANMANLLLARTSARRHELATRLALGAGRVSLLRHVLTESLLLSTAGSILGLAIAWGGSRTLLSIIQRGEADPLLLDVSPDGRVLMFTAGLAVITAILAGVVPAWRAASLTLSGGRAVGRTVHARGRLAPALVAAQVALSLLLLVAAGLFVRTLHNLRTLDTGFQRDHVLTFEVSPERRDISRVELADVLERVRDAVAVVPGVRAVSFAGATPVSGGAILTPFVVQDRSTDADGVLTHFVAPGYFAAMRMRLRAGRDFADADREQAPLVAIVNEAFVRAWLREGDPMSQVISVAGPRRVDRRIVGVVADAVHRDLRTPPPPAVYLPFAQMSASGAGFSAGTYAVLVAPSFAGVDRVRAAVAPYTPGPPIEIHSLTDLVERTLVQERLMATLAGAFALLALALAAVGLYGLLSYTVTQRTGELGVRSALGASPGDVIRLVMRDAGWMLAAGIAIGLPLAAVCSRAVQTMLFRLEPGDPWNLASALVVLGVAAMTAAWLPARRAARVDPVIALRAE